MDADKKAKYPDYPNVKGEQWNAEEISGESVNQLPDEIARQFLRGDETSGNPDDRDVVGASDTINTPQGREETKIKDKKI